MTEFLEFDKDVSVKEIEELFQKSDFHGVFKTRHRWRDNFIKHFEKIIEVRQIVTFRRDGELVGLCSWILVDKKSKVELNKTTWKIPDNIVDGDILYVDVCVLNETSGIFKIRNFLSNRHRKSVKEVFWFDVPNGRVFRLKFKGGIPCKIAD